MKNVQLLRSLICSFALAFGFFLGVIIPRPVVAPAYVLLSATPGGVELSWAPSSHDTIALVVSTAAGTDRVIFLNDTTMVTYQIGRLLQEPSRTTFWVTEFRRRPSGAIQQTGKYGPYAPRGVQ